MSHPFLLGLDVKSKWVTTKSLVIDTLEIGPGLPHLFIGLLLFLAFAAVLRGRRDGLRVAFLGVVALQLLNEALDFWASDVTSWFSLGEAVLDTAITIMIPGLIWWSAHSASAKPSEG